MTSLSSSSSQLFNSIKDLHNQKAISLSEQIIDDLEDIVDENMRTLLHIAANNNNLEMAEYYFQAYNQLIKTKPTLHSKQTKSLWVRARDNEGFSCLHYAVFRANFKMVTLLQENGADIYQINNLGLTVLHIAAQGDSPLLILYFLNKGLKIGVADGKGGTPLHWACYSGKETAAYALISWNAQIDKQQFTFGMTPLHLAVMSGNGPIVKKLLHKGCDRNIRAYNGKLPLDIAKQNQYKKISQMIIDKQGIEQLMNIKIPYRKLNRHTLSFYLLLFLYLSNYLLNVSFVIHSSVKSELYLSIAFLVIGLIVGILFVICKVSNPGELKYQRKYEMYQTLLKTNPQNICFDCKIIKPQRSRHCQICNQCICVYDHHCPWIANCVGSHNYIYFFSFLISMLIFMSFTIGFEIVNLCDTDWNLVTTLMTLQIITEIYSLLIAMLFILPLIFLIIVQIKNLSQNKTTFQRFSYKKKTKQNKNMQNRKQSQNSSNSYSVSQTSELKMKLLEGKELMKNQPETEIQLAELNQFTKSSWRNCYMMCLGNRNQIQYQFAV